METLIIAEAVTELISYSTENESSLFIIIVIYL